MARADNSSASPYYFVHDSVGSVLHFNLHLSLTGYNFLKVVAVVLVQTTQEGVFLKH